MAIDTFASRITKAVAKEVADTEKLEQKYGCKVYRFGQALLPDDAREYLRYHPNPLYVRWLSDLLAVRPDLWRARALESMWFIDSKIGREDTLYWDLEKAAHTAHRLQQIALGLPIVYIWPDGCSCSYVDDLPDEVLKDGPPNRSGSGTPYWLVLKKLTRTLDDVFGKASPPDPFADEEDAA
jgi:hypothetical protein